MQICAESVNYYEDSSEESGMMQPRTAKIVKDFLEHSPYKKEVPD